ncbi:Transcription elongation factor B (SIII), polypeptide 1 (15kDa, elongin C) [Extremus antarcticus]|uniref:Elongin-C n=1 Tax=Extremus antarcticus TaxID=702011 RepID=A0AAJ0D9W1_9PEZI|nr:Transcription elongation factor B (SIII), polypeptide 1 (15kDa, elongin C) [Extremus antarcticus]
MASETEYVTLVSSDGFSFVVLRSAAIKSPAIMRMLDPAYGFAESKTNTCHFENINGLVLEKVCEYFYYYQKHKGAKDVTDMDFPIELSLELVMAADYLDSRDTHQAGFIYI